MRFKQVLLIIMFTIAFGIARAQNEEVKPIPDFHKIVLEEPVNFIQRAVYINDGRRIDTQIEEGGTAIILPSYDYEGRSRVSIMVKYKDGRVEELVKSFCQIEPYYISKEL